MNFFCIGTDTYDASIVVASFAPGHMDQESFPEIIRITKPGELCLLQFLILINTLQVVALAVLSQKTQNIATNLQRPTTVINAARISDH